MNSFYFIKNSKDLQNFIFIFIFYCPKDPRDPILEEIILTERREKKIGKFFEFERSRALWKVIFPFCSFCSFCSFFKILRIWSRFLHFYIFFIFFKIEPPNPKETLRKVLTGVENRITIFLLISFIQIKQKKQKRFVSPKSLKN